MSADNYRSCPRCFACAVKKYVEDQERLKVAYGQVSKEEFEKLHAEIGKVPVCSEMPNTLSEVWEIGLSDDELSIYYGCNCETCGFQHNFNYEEPLEFDP